LATTPSGTYRLSVRRLCRICVDKPIQELRSMREMRRRKMRVPPHRRRRLPSTHLLKIVPQKRPTRAEIRAKLNSGEITWQKVFELLLAPKPWESPEWKQQRERVLQTTCEECGTTEPPLVVQHMWHPSAFAELCEVAKHSLRDEFRRSHPYDPPQIPPFDPLLVPPQPSTERNCCPRCDSVNIRFYKTFAKWHCNALGCGSYFDSPSKRLYQRFDNERWIEKARHHHTRPIREYDKQWEDSFTTACYDQICTLATTLSFLEHDRYIEMRPRTSLPYASDARISKTPNMLTVRLVRSGLAVKNDSERSLRSSTFTHLKTPESPCPHHLTPSQRMLDNRARICFPSVLN